MSDLMGKAGNGRAGELIKDGYHMNKFPISNTWLNSKLYVLILISFLASCASQKAVTKEASGETQANGELTEKQVYERLSKKLDTLISKAQKAGPDSVKFLGSDIYLKASAASIQGDSQTAGFLFQNLSKLYPQDDYVKTRYAVELIRQGQLSAAQEILEGINKRADSKDSKVALLLGAIYSSSNKFKEAEKLYSAVVKHDPTNIDACLLLVKERLKRDRANGYPKAISTLNNCDKKTGREHAVISFFMGKISLDFDKKNTAKKHFQTTLKRDESYFQAALGIGLILEQEEKFDKATAAYEKFLSSNPTNKTILSRLIQVLFSTGKYKKIIPYAETLAKIDPSDLNLKVRLGILYSDSKKFDKAIELFKDVLKEVPDSDKIHYYLGAIYQETGEYEPAMESYAKVSDQSSLFLDSNLQIAQLLKKMAIAGPEGKRKDFEYRLESFVWSRAEKIQGLKIKLPTVLASFHEENSNFESAISVIEKASKGSQLDENQLYYLASLYEKNEQVDMSKSTIEKVLVINPNNAHALNFLGYTMLENNENLEESLRLIQKAVKLAPEDGYIRDSLGWYYYKTGNYKQALKHLLIAVKKVGNDAIILKHVGLVYKSMKNYAKARQYFNLSLEKTTDVALRKKVENYLYEMGQKRLPAAR